MRKGAWLTFFGIMWEKYHLSDKIIFWKCLLYYKRHLALRFLRNMPTPCSNDLRCQIVWLVSDIQKTTDETARFPCRSARRLWTSPTDDNSSPSRASALESTETQSKREAFDFIIGKWNNCVVLKAIMKLPDHNWILLAIQSARESLCLTHFFMPFDEQH